MNAAAISFLAIGLISGGTIGWFAKDATETLEASKGTSSAPFKSASTGDSFSSQRSAHKSTSLNDSVAIIGITSSEINSLGQQFSQSLDPIERSRIFDRLIASMTLENALEIREYVKGLSHRDPDFRKFNLAYGRIAGLDAVKFAINSPERDGSFIFQGWTSVNPEAAKEWLHTMGEQDVAGMAELKEQGFTVESLKRQFHQELVKGLYINNPNEAAAYIGSLDDSQYNFAKNSSEELVNDLVNRNGPEAAIDWAANLPSGNVANATYGEIADEWSEKDAEAALAWAQTQQNDEQRQSALRQIWRNMASGIGGTNAFEAAEQINNMPESIDKDHALVGYSRGVLNRHPQTAVEAAMSIGDPAMRKINLLTTAAHYFRNDRKGANVWLENSGLSQELTTQIKNNANSRRSNR